MMQFRALTDLYLPNCIYIQAGTVFTAPSGWSPPTNAVCPLDPDAVSAYWNVGPRGCSDAEYWRATSSNSARWSDVPVAPPTSYWQPVDPKKRDLGFVLEGAGSNLGPKSVM